MWWNVLAFRPPFILKEHLTYSCGYLYICCVWFAHTLLRIFACKLVCICVVLLDPKKGLKGIPYFWNNYICLAKGRLLIRLKEEIWLGFLAAEEKVSIKVKQLLKEKKHSYPWNKVPPQSLRSPRRVNAVSLEVLRWEPAYVTAYRPGSAWATPTCESSGRGGRFHGRSGRWRPGTQLSGVWSRVPAWASRAHLQSWGQNPCDPRPHNCHHGLKGPGIRRG